MASDLPPPYTAMSRHPMMPRANHDETARFNFLTHFNRYLSGGIGAGNKLVIFASGFLPGGNPATERVSLSLDLVEASPVRLQLINQLGQVIRQENLGLQEAGFPTEYGIG